MEMSLDSWMPAGEDTLSNATTAVNGTGGTRPYNATFDPTGHFDISFNPNRLKNDDTRDGWSVL